MFFELPGTFILPICWLLTWCNLVFWSGESIRMRAFDLILCWRRLAPPQAAPLCYSNIIQGRNGAADFPTENCSSIVWLCQNTLLPIMTNAPSESQQHKMVPFFPMKMLAGYNLLNWGQWIFFLCSFIKKFMFGCTVYLPPNCWSVYFSTSTPSNVEDVWSSVWFFFNAASNILS